MKNSSGIRKALVAFICMMISLQIYAEQDTVLYLFMGHPRDDDRTHEHVLKTVEKLDYSKYELLLLGGDLTWNTSELISTLEYCDIIFHLSDSNTHLAIGNHDLDNPTNLLNFTKKGRYHAISRNNISFLVLDTELTTPNIAGAQLDFVKSVTDTITNSDYLILIHHRILWMAGNDDLAHLNDSVAASTRNLGPSNFFPEVYPLLQEVKQRGIEVLCLAGDRTDINISYAIEDSIQFLASGMVGTFPDINNFVILLTHDLSNHKLNYDFVPLSELDTLDSIPIIQSHTWDKKESDYRIYPNPCSDYIHIYFNNSTREKHIDIYSLQGIRVYEADIPRYTEFWIVPASNLNQNIYYIRIYNSNASAIKKILVIH